MAADNKNNGNDLISEICGYNQEQLFDLGIKLCTAVKEDVGASGYRGGIFPQNISLKEDGSIAIGPSGDSKSWSKEQLQFLSPEEYWHNKGTPASDIYSIGLLLYFAAAGGKLPLEGKYADPMMRRISGEKFTPPKAAGRRLGEIISKATAFQAKDRYGTVGQMKDALTEGKAKLFEGKPKAEEILGKSDDELSDLESMMVSIMEKSSEAEDTAEEDAPVEEVCAEDEAASAEEEKIAHTEGEEKAEGDDEFVPVLKQEDEPELAPIIPESIPIPQIKAPTPRYARNLERERQIKKEASKRRKRPVAIVVVLTAVLIMIAIAVNAVQNGGVMEGMPDAMSGIVKSPEASFVPSQSNDGSDVPESTPDIPLPTQTPEPTPVVVTPKPQSTYEIIVDDVSWTEARDRCREMGGYLVVINDRDELIKVVQMVEDAGIDRIWVGIHREGDQLITESGEAADFLPWAEGEPSYEDSYDGASEDYILLWYLKAWVYNDSRNDPIADYPQWYRGRIGFVCEIPG